jgi:hypothetical protein
MLRNRSTSLKLEKKILITVIFTIMCTTSQQRRCVCRQRFPHPHMDCLRWFRCNSSVLWTYCHRPVARFQRRRQGRQSKYGRHGGDFGGATTVNLALSTSAFSPPDKFANSTNCIPVPSMLLMRGCKGVGWEGVWEELFIHDRRCS